MTEKKERLHFIAIGGSLMHNLALALHKNGYAVTGSDDEIYEPSRSKLETAGLLPEEIGWNADRITNDIDAIILGMHARADNPELLRAQELNLPIFSFPEYIYQQSQQKQRIVVTGSHGKSTITSMLMHVLAFHNREFDFAVGAELPGFETTVRLSDAPVIVIEGDEYLSSPIDREPKFMKYKHHIGLISGIAWDHVNVFPTEKNYIEQFQKFADATPKAGSLVLCEEDEQAMKIGNEDNRDVMLHPYGTPDYEIKNGITNLVHDGRMIPLKIFGKHNLQNLMGAKQILGRIGITDDMFFEAISSFEGASRRLEIISDNGSGKVFRDYAHAPSKVKASIQAVREQFPDQKIIACLELHTFSSLNEEFLPQYKKSLDEADIPVVYFNPKTIQHKKLPPLTEKQVSKGFDNNKLRVFTNQKELLSFLKDQELQDKIVLMMSSGNFDKMDTSEITSQIAK